VAQVAQVAHHMAQVAHQVAQVAQVAWFAVVEEQSHFWHFHENEMAHRMWALWAFVAALEMTFVEHLAPHPEECGSLSG